MYSLAQTRIYLDPLRPYGEATRFEGPTHEYANQVSWKRPLMVLAGVCKSRL